MTTEQDIVENLRTRAAIRRNIPRAVDGKPDRISDLCEQAADEIERLRGSTPSRVIFSRLYDGESIIDVDRDVIEAFDTKFNDSVDMIPADENGFLMGQFEVTVKWINNQ